MLGTNISHIDYSPGSICQDFIFDWNETMKKKKRRRNDVTQLADKPAESDCSQGA